MNIVRENLEDLTTLLKVTVGEADYNEAVDKSLRTYRRKANIPGFRPGMVPMSIINKMYRKGVVAEEAYRTASKACFDYIETEKLTTVGDMIPSQKQQPLDFDNDTENAEKVMATLAHYMSGGKKKNSVSAASTGATYYTSGFSLEFLMLDGHSLYEKFRLLAPVLKKFGARLVVLKGGRPLVYDCENGPRIASETLS